MEFLGHLVFLGAILRFRTSYQNCQELGTQVQFQGGFLLVEWNFVSERLEKQCVVAEVVVCPIDI